MKFAARTLAALTLAAGTAITLPSSLAMAQGAEAAAKADGKTDMLIVGSPAPAIKVAKWFKGNEVKSFEKGKTYVVEFWATWCGPCRKSIPHLTEMAKEYKDKVNFVGVSVWEREDTYLNDVDAFVKKMGDKMDYNVCADDKVGDEGSMAKNWMTAAGQGGIPTAFIVNGDSKIVWIGHPMEMAKPLAEVVAGKWDLAKAVEESKKAAAKAAQEKADQKILMTEGMELSSAFQAGDFAKAATEAEKLLKKHPSLSRTLVPVKFMALTKSDPKSAYGMTGDLVKEFKDEPQMLNQIAWGVLEDKTLKDVDYGAMMNVAKAAADATKNEDGTILDTVALAASKKGDLKTAIEIQTKAVDLVKKAGSDPAMIQEMQDRLDGYTKASK